MNFMVVFNFNKILVLRHFCGTSSAHSKVPREVQRTANKVTNSDWKIACEPICGHNKTRIPTYELQGLLRMQILHFIKRKLMKIHYSASVKCSCYMFFHGTVRTAKHSTRKSQVKKPFEWLRAAFTSILNFDFLSFNDCFQTFSLFLRIFFLPFDSIFSLFYYNAPTLSMTSCNI